MTLNEIIRWAESKNCNDHRQTGHCEHAACDENDRVIAVLRRARRFRGSAENGEPVAGWLIPDR